MKKIKVEIPKYDLKNGILNIKLTEDKGDFSTISVGYKTLLPFAISVNSEIRDFFTPLREKYLKSGLLDPKMLGVDANTLLYQVPGGRSVHG
jgi:hypothetical protein